MGLIFREPKLFNMGSEESDEALGLFADEIQQLHKSLEQLNSLPSKDMPSAESMPTKSAARKRNKPSLESVDVQTQTPKKTRKKKEPIPEDVIQQLDSKIDSVLEEIAERKNLTRPNVKNMLRKIIADDSVKEMLNCLVDSNATMSFEPKLTRSKTREWLETQPQFQQSKNTSETSMLMEGELLEDSSDDEYRPNEDDADIHSDEESFLSSHASDVGSPTSSFPPATPCSEDLFKKPLPIQGNDDLIGYRTRSKLPLNDTPLECLEMAFMPPDISTDMYDSDCDNEEWRKFLKEYVSPPVQHGHEAVDDEEADPEYNVLEDEEEIDPEELRADRTVQITKKEVSELLSEFFEEDFSSTDDEDAGRMAAAPPPQDLLQTAVSLHSIQDLPPGTPPECEKSLNPNKPTGVVLPLPFNQTAEPENLTLTVSFPTMNYAPLEIRCEPPSPKQDELAAAAYNPLLPPESKLILEEQLRKHVQLLTQMHLITAQQSELAAVTSECRKMLTELVPCTSTVAIANLNEAVKLTGRWEASVTSISFRLDYHQYTRKVTSNGNKKMFVNRCNKHPERFPFDPSLVDVMANSRVFIYPELLPKLAIYEIEKGPCVPSVHEEHLLALGLEQFMPYCRDILGEKATTGDVKRLAYSLIKHYLLPHSTEKQIASRISRLLKPSCPSNPVKYYRDHLKAPPVVHQIPVFDSNSMVRLCDVPLKLLPERWRNLMMRQQAVEHSLNTSIPSLAPVPPVKRKIEKKSKSKKKKEDAKPRKKQKIDKPSSDSDKPGIPCQDQPGIDLNQVNEEIIHLPAHDDLEELPDTHSDDEPEPSQNPTTLSVDECKEVPPAEAEPPLVDLVESDCEETFTLTLDEDSLDEPPKPVECVIAPEVKSDPVIDDPEVELDPVIEESNSSKEKQLEHHSPTEQPVKRYVLLKRLSSNAAHVMHVWGPNLRQPVIPVRRVGDTNEQKSPDTKSSQVEQKSSSSSKPTISGETSSGLSSTRMASSSGGDDGEEKRPNSGGKPPPAAAINESIDDIMGEEEEEEDTAQIQAALTATTLAAAPPSNKVKSPTHRQVRNQRNARRILDTWMADDPIESRNDAYARVYLNKVRDHLGHNDPAYVEFTQLLSDLYSQPESVREIYLKMENMLTQELMEEFVIFLTPEQAALCGKEFQHFFLVRMREFFSKLKIHYKDSPTQLKRILKTLQGVHDNPSGTVNDIKNSMIPLLKGNPHLTQCFLQFFLDDAPLQSESTDFEEVNLDQNASGDEFEYVDYKEAGALGKTEAKNTKKATTKAVSKSKSKGKSWRK